MTDIFISYAREDEVQIRSLVQALQPQGWSIFWDRRIPAGETWRTYIGKALDEARCVIVAWTHNSVDSNWVLEEAEDAKRRRVLVPILFESIEQPRGFREIQAADLSGWQPGRDSMEFDQLVHDLHLLLKSAPVKVHETSVGSVSAAKPVSIKAALKAVGLALLIISLGVGIFYLALRLKEQKDQSPPVKSPPVAPETTNAQENTTTLETTPVGPISSVTRGTATVFGGNSRYSESGFNFASETVVAWNSGQADLLVEDSPTAKAHFFMQQDTKDPVLSGSLQDKGAKSGIQRVGAASLDELRECPETGYQYFRVEADEGAIYCVRTRDGQHFAKIQVISVKSDSIKFDWQYQALGLQGFN